MSDPDRDRPAGGPVPAADGDGGAPDPGAAAPGDDQDEVLEGELVEPSTAGQAEADALLAEALDAADIEAQFSAAEADAAAAAEATAQTRTPGIPDPVAILTADLQRVHAEYSNYRKRVERDRGLVRERAVEAVLADLLPVLDDLVRAEEHGELVGGFKAVGEAIRATLAKHGLSTFGAPGEPFDPTRHEALMREVAEGIDEPTVVRVLQVGYELRGRVVRPARVSVAGTD